MTIESELQGVHRIETEHVMIDGNGQKKVTGCIYEIGYSPAIQMHVYLLKHSWNKGGESLCKQ